MKFFLHLAPANISLVFLCLQKNAQIVPKFKIAVEYFSVYVKINPPALKTKKLYFQIFFAINQ